MLDAYIRPIINFPLEKVAKIFVNNNITANQITYTGFAIGMIAALLLYAGLYIPALVFIALNRFCDGLDGAVARVANKQTDYGGYLDIVLDFIFYSAVIFGFCLGHPDQAIYGAFLIFSFMGTGSSFLAYAIIAERRKLETTVRGRKSFFYVGGLAEGTETIITLCLMCLLPQFFYLFALIFGLMCWITTLSRIIEAKEMFVENQ